MRYALYFTPPISDPLARVATNWLGRNAFSGKIVEPPAITALSPEEMAAHTADPRRYGFHATLKAPFRLADAEGEPELLSEIMHFCSDLTPFILPIFEITRIGPFFALTPGAPSAELQDFADRVVTHFDRFRAPLSDADLARRASSRLDQKQLEYLHRWGYPYVLDEFRFHMTLTGPVEEQEQPRVERALHDFFGPVLSDPVAVTSLALFSEPEPGAAFMVHSLHPLGAVDRRQKISV